MVNTMVLVQNKESLTIALKSVLLNQKVTKKLINLHSQLTQTPF